MNTARQSLRALVDKWLAPTPGTPARVTRFSRMSSNHRRYVCVETARQTDVLAIYFFRHDDGWRNSTNLQTPEATTLLLAARSNLRRSRVVSVSSTALTIFIEAID
jgi:hypothetical protein